MREKKKSSGPINVFEFAQAVDYLVENDPQVIENWVDKHIRAKLIDKRKEGCMKGLKVFSMVLFFVALIGCARGRYVPDADPNCPKCKGTGRYVCLECNGKIDLKCVRCDGAGITTCDVCQGKGDLRCYNCNGSGFVSGEQCRICSGRGWARCAKYLKKGTYVTCNGTGQVKCNNCYGEGVKRCSRCKNGWVNCEIWVPTD